MPCQTSISTRESADAAARILVAVCNGTRDEIEQELHLAAQVCTQPFDGDSAEAERRELLDSIVSRFRQALVDGEQISSNSHSLSGCFTLLQHLGGRRRAYAQVAGSHLPEEKLVFLFC